jgi:hypothetical protein
MNRIAKAIALADLPSLGLQDCTSSFPNYFKDCEGIIVIAVSRHQIC